MRSFITLIFISYFFNAISQEKPNSKVLLIETSSVNFSYEQHVEVSEFSETFSFIFSNLKYRDKDRLAKKDKKTVKILSKLALEEEDSEKRFMYLELISKYTDDEKVYVTDTVIIKKANHPNFTNLFTEILTSHKDVLLEDKRDQSKGQYVTLDGKHLKLEIYNNKRKTMNLNIYAPNMESHPKVYNFYRTAKNIRNNNR